MSIHMRQLSPDTYDALVHLCEERQWAPSHAWMEPEQVAWLAARLEFVPDDAQTFPKGKWATIHRLQDLVRQAAKAEAAP